MFPFAVAGFPVSVLFINFFQFCTFIVSYRFARKDLVVFQYGLYSRWIDVVLILPKNIGTFGYPTVPHGSQLILSCFQIWSRFLNPFKYLSCSSEIYKSYGRLSYLGLKHLGLKSVLHTHSA